MISGDRKAWRRFRAWQLNPFSYDSLSETVHRCANCEHEFTGDYCPRCSQKAGLGRVNWRSVRKSFGEVWGMGNRSMIYSLVQLHFRPGYFIRDYISGKRQVSFPPVKMLLIVALLVTALSQVFHLDANFAPPSDERVDVIDNFVNWADDNKGWGMIALSSLMIAPTWVLFRHAPGYSHHTLPEGFFIQVFMGILMILFLFIDLFDLPLVMLILPVAYYLIAYHQLFGYKWWPTLWRTLLCLFEALLCGLILASLFEFINQGYERASHFFGGIFLIMFLLLAMVALPLWLGYVIGRRSEKQSDSCSSVAVSNEQN